MEHAKNQLKILTTLLLCPPKEIGSRTKNFTNHLKTPTHNVIMKELKGLWGCGAWPKSWQTSLQNIFDDSLI